MTSEQNRTHVELLTERCEGTGFCARVAPELFEVREGVVHLRTAELNADSLARAREAEDLCPTQTIRVVEG